MSESTGESRSAHAQAEALVAAADTGARQPGGAVGLFLAAVALAWSLFQLLLASPVSNLVLPSDIINNARQVHLAFAIFLAFALYPALATSARAHVPWQDWLFAIAGAVIAMYGYIAYEKIVQSGGLADDTDEWIALAGLILLFEGARRALGPALAIIATLFLLYVFFGASPWVPEVIRWKGASLQKAMSHMWITSEGVFGIALGVSTKFVFLFVLFGALLEKAGAGNYFIQMAFGALGHLRGGPAKAAVVGSAATGLISGSSIANVVTTGTFTIPLMRRVGFSRERAGAVEVASSVNGQIMPPVMGAAAFLMVEYIGISYVEVITHAFLPAVISYIALVYIVHLEAVKRNMPTLGNRVTSLAKTVGGMFAFFAGFAALCYGLQFPVSWVVALVPEGAGWVLALLLALAYVGLLALAARAPDLEEQLDPAKGLPEVGRIYATGLHFLLPILVLVYFLMIERKSPGLSAFWASALMVFILLTQHPLKAALRRRGALGAAFGRGVQDLGSGLITGARNMIGIGLATATAGVIVGTVTLTGIGQVMADLVEFVSGGNLLAMLAFVGLLSLVLGMGLPTTANYIVVSSLLAGVVVELGAQSGLIVPLIAVHLFVFYFGIMADVTPPVGLASFAAAAVSGGDAIRTGIIAFFYSLRTVALPFFFIFNTDLLLINVTPLQAVVVFVVATVAMLAFTSATMGWFLTRNRLYESVALALVAFLLFRPDFVMDRIAPPFADQPPAALEQVLAEADEGARLRLVVRGPDFDTLELTDITVPVDVQGADGAARLAATGLLPMGAGEGGALLIDEPMFGTALGERLAGLDFYADEPVQIVALRAPARQPAQELVFIPALLLLGGVALMQRRRARRQEAAAA